MLCSYCQGLETIEGISLDTSTCNREISLLPTTFSKMRRLRLLKVNGGKLCLPQDHPLAFPCKLKYINWYACPLKSLSTNFIAEMLVALDMRGSRLEKLWEGAPVRLTNFVYLLVYNKNLHYNFQFFFQNQLLFLKIKIDTIKFDFSNFHIPNLPTTLVKIEVS